MMMFNYVCADDRVVFRVSSMDPSVRILPVIIDCPRCQKPITCCPNWPVENEVLILSAEELFRAANGLPLPDTENASEARVYYLLTKGVIIDAKLIPVDQDRVVIESLTVKAEHKYTLHFATSTKGATIYKVTNP